MLFNMFTVILLLFSITMADYIPKKVLNVGTVLFCKDDIMKPHWTKSQLSLLRARIYFQTILPPSDFIATFNDDYVNILLEYIRDAYSNIKREATDLETDSIMTAALSDTLGGYFKAWVLPVAKLDYYGGTVSQDNVIKLYQFYGEIKSYLDTDGDGWYGPDETFVNFISINVAGRPHIEVVNPCEQFAYFEKTRHGLGIPLPTVNWNEKSSTLFVPLKNVTMIPLIARDTSNTLVNYYDTAKNCLTESNPADVEEFDKKFETWLLNNIMPHLKDEHLYLALGNVLSLLNMTNNHFDNVALMDRSVKHPILFTPKAVEVPSKKVTIILIILFLEIMWCIPAVIYLLCSKKKKDCTSNVYLFIDQNKPDKPYNLEKQENEETNVNVKCSKKKLTTNVVKINQSWKPMESKDLETQYPSTMVCRTNTITSALQLGQKNDTYFMEFQGQCPSSDFRKSAGTGSRAFYSFKNQSSETIKTSPIPYDAKKSALKKKTDSPRIVEAQHVITLQHQNEVAHGQINVNSLPKKTSHSKENRKESKCVVTPKRNHEKSSKNISRRRTDHGKDIKAAVQKKPESQHHENTENTSKTKAMKIPTGILKTTQVESVKKTECSLMIKTDSETITEKEQSSHLYFTDTAICPCTGCVVSDINVVRNISEKVSEKMTIQEQLPTEKNVLSIVPSPTRYDNDNKLIEIKSARPVKEYFRSSRSKKPSIEVNEDMNNYLKMSIQKPTTEISLNIGPVQISKEFKRSKIPKPANSSKVVMSRISQRIREVLSPVPESTRKSLIPQPKKKTVDDMALNSLSSKSIVTNEHQLNETF